MYTALYRQWRPYTFESVVGQDTIVRTLGNQIKSGRIAHAYLFCGSRGTGKTSTAKIFSRAINCLSPTDAGPCGGCDTCTKLSSGNHMDIIEIDAASNNGVDEIRDLRDKVKYPPTIGKYKVYIIDEVHMLSIGAFNALLKTLEEPPGHVVFILATTEAHKLPATILSRCQRYDFKRISLRHIVDRMKTICSAMEIEVEETGLFAIARWAEGGMRDALSLLDQCMGFCGKSIRAEDIFFVLGTTHQDFIFDAVDHILSGETSPLLLGIGRLMDDGRDLNVYLKDMIHHFRNLLVVKLCEHPQELLDVEESTMIRLKDQASTSGESRIIRAIDILSALEGEFRRSTQPRVLFELAIVKICRPSQEGSMEALLDRIDQMERQLANGVVIDKQDGRKENVEANQISGSARNKTDINDNPESSKMHPGLDNKSVEQAVDKGDALIKASKDGSSKPRDIEECWPDILKAIKKERFPIYPLVSDVKPASDSNGVVTLIYSPQQEFFAAAMEKDENRSFLEGLIERVAGRTIKLRTQVGAQQEKSKESQDDHFMQKAYALFGKDIVEVVDEE